MSVGVATEQVGVVSMLTNVSRIFTTVQVIPSQLFVCLFN